MTEQSLGQPVLLFSAKQGGIKESSDNVYSNPSGIFNVTNKHKCYSFKCDPLLQISGLLAGLEADLRESETYRYLEIRPSRRDSPSLHHNASLWRYRSPGLCIQTAWSCTSWGDRLLWELEKKKAARKRQQLKCVSVTKHRNRWKSERERL